MCDWCAKPTDRAASSSGTPETSSRCASAICNSNHQLLGRLAVRPAVEAVEVVRAELGYGGEFPERRDAAEVLEDEGVRLRETGGDAGVDALGVGRSGHVNRWNRVSACRPVRGFPWQSSACLACARSPMIYAQQTWPAPALAPVRRSMPWRYAQRSTHLRATRLHRAGGRPRCEVTQLAADVVARAAGQPHVEQRDVGARSRRRPGPRPPPTMDFRRN